MTKRNPYSPQDTSVVRLFGLFILMGFVFALGWNVGLNHSKLPILANGSNQIRSAAQGNDQVDMQLFWDVWNLLASRYVDPGALNYKEMVYGAIRGMVFSLNDPYTAFLTPKENKDFQDNLDGNLEGIGAELTLRNEQVTVVSPLKNSPAKKAGLQPEDIIFKVDGEEILDVDFREVIRKIRGPKGSTVVLSILRKENPNLIDIPIVRDSINVSSVSWKMVEEFALIELNQFGTTTTDEFNKAVNEILAARPKGLILDLRYNGGGFLDGAVDIASEFIQNGKVVSIKKRNPEDDEVIYVNGRARILSYPLVVLINKGSASASEIVAGAIQDNNRGMIIGEPSFGKGTVQEVDNLIDGSSIRLTIAKWFTPNDINISEKGIMPDIIVERTEEDIEKQQDPQLDRAIEHLKSL